MMKLLVALVLFVTVECAPQRRPPPQDVTSGGPIYVKGLLSQIHELRSNIQENRRRIVGPIFDPVGHGGRPHHDHRKGGRPHNSGEDFGLNQRAQLPTLDEPTQGKNRKENPKKVEKGEVPSKVLPPPPPSAGLPPPPPSGGLPPRPSSGTILSTEDWSHAVAASEKDDDDLKRKIITAPCLGGITATGECRPHFK